MVTKRCDFRNAKQFTGPIKKYRGGQINMYKIVRLITELLI